MGVVAAGRHDAGFPVGASLISGTGFVLTSTAIVMQMLEERVEMSTRADGRIVSILLFEDLAIVPLGAGHRSLARAAGGDWRSLTGAAIGIGLDRGADRWRVLPAEPVLQPLLVRFGGREVMTAAGCWWCWAQPLAFDAGGRLSMAMGAFLAGVLCRKAPSATSLRQTSNLPRVCCWGCSSWASAWR